MPYFSNGSVDGLVQKQYLRATYAHWQERANNPVSDIYFKPMVDLENSHVWAWDARPWPDFPNRLDVWSDGGNHARGHWLTGRFAEQSLAAIVSEVCEISGLQDIDVSELYGQTIGFAMRSLETGRQSLQPLMMAFDFSSGEVDGKLRFRNRTQKIEYSVAPTDLAIQGKEPAFEKLRQPEAETIGRVRVSFWDDMRDYQTGTSEFVRGDDTSQATSHVELPLTLLPTFGVNLAARWLSEARIARDEINLALPMSVQHLTTGDVVRLSGSGTDAIYRVERIEEQGARRIEGTRVEQTVFKQKDVSKIIGRNPSVPLVSAVHYQYLDLPMLRSNQDPFSPFVAATSAPWPGFAAVYTSHSDDGYVFNASIDRPNQFATTLSSLRSAFSGRWSRAETLRVRLSSGVLQSRSELEVFAGANTAVIGDGSSTGWEVFQFKNAELQGDGTYLLNEFLRGQLGTEAEMQAVWPAESKVIFLDDTLSQLSLSDADRGVERFFRVGPGNRVVSDPSFTTFQQSFSGVSLRPLSPVHLAVRKMFIVAPDVYYLRLTWKRRSRIEGDNWQNFEVPLGEANETYIVRVLQGGNLLREDFVGSPKFIYEHEQIVGDGVEGLVTFEVAQVSEKYGPGVFERIEFNV